MRHQFRRDAAASVGDDDFYARAGTRGRDRHLAALRELDGVADEVEENLLEAEGVHKNRGNAVREVHELDSLLCRDARERRKYIVREGGNLHRLGFEHKFARVDLRNVKDVVHEL